MAPKKDETKAVNEEVSEQNLDTTPVSEEQAPEEVVEAPVETESTEEAQTEEQTTETAESEPEAPRKGYTARVQELVKERDTEREKAKSLADQLAKLTGSVEPSGVPQIPQVQPGAEVSPEQYQQHVLRTADALVTLRTKQSEAVNRINNEAQDVVRAYPELDPESESFNKELSDTITEATEAYVSKNPYTASVKNFVARLMKPYKGAVAKEVGEATETMARQASQTALRPTTVRKGEKAPEEKSIQELEKELGVVQA